MASISEYTRPFPTTQNQCDCSLHVRTHGGVVRSTYQNTEAGNCREREMKNSLVLLKLVAITVKTL